MRYYRRESLGEKKKKTKQRSKKNNKNTVPQFEDISTI